MKWAKSNAMSKMPKKQETNGMKKKRSTENEREKKQ